MQQRSRSLILILALVAGCTPAPGTVSTRKSPAPVVAATSPAIVKALPSAGLTGTGIISNNAANLTGKVKVPSGIVSDNGGSVISDHGGAIIANNGGGILGNNGASWKLLAAKPQLPYVGAEVRLVDAAGKPVPGPDGKPLTATTDAQGAYSFTATLPQQNLLIDVTLPEGKGAVRAVVPKSAASQQVVDVDLVSTLTTGYIVEQYVKTQKDPIATLEKLPAAVEAETRAKAAAAVAAQDFTPKDLLTPAVVQAVEDLRKADKTLDAQMETVKRLLVVAGASDLGSGLKALEVTLTSVDQFRFTADGAVYMLATQDNRIWKLRLDGTLEIAAGDRRPPDLTDLTGKLPTEANLNHPDRIALDPQGRLAFCDARGVWLVGTDGKLQRLSDKKVVDFAVGKDGDLLTIVEEEGTYDPEEIAENGPPMFTKALSLYHTKPGAAPERLLMQIEDPGDDGYQTFFYRGLAWDGSNAAWANVGNGATGHSELWKIDVAAKAKTVETPATSASELYFDGQHVIYSDAAGAFHGKPLYGPGAVQDIPRPEQWSSNLSIGPDGKPYASKFGALYRLEPAGPVRIAGTEGNAAGGSATVFTFEVLSDSAVDPKGNVYALDTGKGGIYKVDANRQITKFAEPGGGNVQMLVCDPAGHLYMSDGDGAKIGRFDDKGVWTALYSVNALISGMAMAADGTGYATNWDTKDRKMRVFRLADGKAMAIDESDARQLIALDAQGTLWAAGGGKLRKWNGTAFTDVKTDDHFTFKGFLGTGGGMVADAKSRLYIADPDTANIFRFDPATGVFTNVAGPGTTHFAAGGTDNGLNRPRTPSMDAAGNLYFSDTGNRQVKRIDTKEL